MIIMKMISLEKTEKIKYPTFSSMHNNSFMKKVPLFSAALSSMILSSTTYAANFEINPNFQIQGGLPLETPNPINIGILYIFLTTSIISLIIVFTNAFKAVKLSKNNKNNESDQNVDNEENIEKLKKLKKKTYIAFAIFMISAAIATFITNFY